MLQIPAQQVQRLFAQRLPAFKYLAVARLQVVSGCPLQLVSIQRLTACRSSAASRS